MCGFIATIVKYVLFMVNLLASIAGLALIGIGSYVLVNIKDIQSELKIPFNIEVLPIAVIGVGCVIFVVAFSGCCGAVKEVRCLLILYGIFMLILAAAKTYLAVAILRSMKYITFRVQDWVFEMFELHSTDGVFYALEKAFSCCGTTGEGSYAGSVFIPGTCCANPIPVPTTDGLSICTPGTTYQGCVYKLGEYINTYGSSVAYFIIIIVVIEVVAMIFAFYFDYTIAKKKQSEKSYY